MTNHVTIQRDGTVIETPFTAEEQAAWDNLNPLATAFDNLRGERNLKLAACDWRVLPDQTPTQSWLDYRQALRDLPENTVDPVNPIWPVAPE